MKTFNPKAFTRKATVFIQKQMKVIGLSKVIVGVSGGVDSACVLTLCVRALGEKNVIAVQLPYGLLNKIGLTNSARVIASNRIPKNNQQIVYIQPMVDAFFSMDTMIVGLRLGNVMARVRMIVLFDLAKKYNALVAGTENKSERLLGYFTRFGDAASDVEIIQSLYKTEVYQLAHYLGVPNEIITTPPTAGLWSGQTDEGELGFSYQDADQVLYCLYDQKMSLDRIIAKGLRRELIEKVRQQVEKNEFKQRVPYVLEH